MMENGVNLKKMEEEYMNIKMEMFLKDIGKMVKNKEEEFIK
jgi:hypothetical protein